jgi:hypothetical protein
MEFEALEMALLFSLHKSEADEGANELLANEATLHDRSSRASLQPHSSGDKVTIGTSWLILMGY